MVSDSSSASLSSSSFFSHPSHSQYTSSSSRSSPSSSPDSAPSSSHDRSCLTSFASSTLSLVPFLWEEKPGVLKKEMQICEGDELNIREGSPSPARHDAPMRTRANLHSSKRLSKTFPTSRSKAVNEGLPRLRPPPRLSQPEHAYAQTDDALRLHQHHHYCRGSTVKSLSSLPFHNRRHHRTPSLEDDPFWMAMVACTNDAGRSNRVRFKDHREKLFGEGSRGDSWLGSRGDSWLAKKVQGHSLNFDQCMPRHVCAVSKAEYHGRRKGLASSDGNTTKDEAASSPADTDADDIKSTSTHAHAIAHTQHHHHQEDVDAPSTRLASKAFKALSIARTELHGRCKALLQQQSAPVDISCGTRISKKRNLAPKRKLPGLFGCKSDGQLILAPRVGPHAEVSVVANVKCD